MSKPENVSIRRILMGILVLVALVAVGIEGYIWAGWEPLESFYFVIITIFGIGFEEVHDINTPFLQLFTIFVIVTGTSAIIYSIGGFLEMVTHGEIRRALQDRRKTQGIETQHDHVIICGFGRMGQILARELRLIRKPFVVIDTDEDRARAAEEDGYLVVIGDATDEEALEHARITHASTVATVLPSDAKNVFITLSARNLNPKLTIISRGELPSTEAKLRQAGADHVVLPAAIGGHRIASMIKHPESTNYSSYVSEDDTMTNELQALGVTLNEFPITLESRFVGQAIHALQQDDDGSFLVVALRRKSGDIVFSPPLDTTLREGDRVFVLNASDHSSSETL